VRETIACDRFPLSPRARSFMLRSPSGLGGGIGSGRGADGSSFARICASECRRGQRHGHRHRVTSGNRDHCTPVTAFNTGTAPAGAIVCPIVVTPSGWTGVLTLSGTDAAKFAIAGTNAVVGPTALPVANYNFSITPAP
jgi:hypothetical protein